MAEEKNKRDEEDKSKDDVEINDEDETTNDDDSTNNDDDSKDDGEDDDDNDSEFKKRFPQFKGETPEEYIERLEDAYEKSTGEGKRLADENASLKEERLKDLADNDKGDDQTTTEEGFGDKYARTQVRKNNREAFDTFVKDHPELSTDPALAARMKAKIGTLAKVAVEEEGEIPDMDELLRGAWAMIAPAGSDISDRNAIKERTAQSKTSSPKNRSKKPEFSEKTIAVAKKMYPTKSEKEIVKLLAKHQS